VDADGDLDFISSSAAGAGVIWLGDGRGAFANAGTLTLPGRNYLSQLTLADIDGDGDLDLLALANNLVSVLFNGGQGTFANKQDSYIGIAALDLAIGDIDADGDLDLVLPGRNSSLGQDLVVVALNNGGGYFAPDLDLQVPGVQQVALADLDGDGDLDLATYSYASYANQATTRLNDGSGRFGVALATLPLAAPDLVLADADADGDLDLITPLGVGLNDGTGKLAQFLSPNEVASTTAIAVGDIDNDGDLDLLTNDQAGTVRVRLNWPTTYASQSRAQQRPSG
jgi:hypothetical protein